MRDSMFSMPRELAPQRTVSLYKDQEDKITQLAKILNRKLSVAEVVRVGVDTILTNLAKEREEETNGKGE